MNWGACVTLSILAGAVCLGSLYANTNGKEKMLRQIQNSGIVTAILINMAFNLLFLLWKGIQIVVFGALRENESKNVYDRLLQYVVLKVLFVAAVNVEPLYSNTKLWIAWFTLIGFMKSLTLLSRDRLEYITTFNPTTSKLVHVKILILLFSILVADVAACYFCFKTFSEDVGIPTLMLLTFEYVALFLDTVQILVKYMIHFIDLSREQTWESRGAFIYYTEFVTDTLILLLTLGHYIQIFFYHGIQFTLIDAILFFHMRIVFSNLRNKIGAYRNYRKLALAMRDKYLDVPTEELNQLDDVCAICHDRMQAAKKLPCGHIFHISCLRSWLENHHNCPTCRFSLIESDEERNRQQQQQQQGGDRVYQFNGRNWFSWLPNIQIVSGRRPLHRIVIPNEMIRRVQEIFPHIPAEVISHDLLMTRNVETTIENFLEGRFPAIPDPIINAPNPFPNNLPAHNPVSSPQRQNGPPLRSLEEELNQHVKSNEEKPVSLDPVQFADDFSTSAVERQQSLASRKQSMLELARKQFLEKEKRKMEINQKEEAVIRTQTPPIEEKNTTTSLREEIISTPVETDPNLRRRLALEAAERRFREQQSSL